MEFTFIIWAQKTLYVKLVWKNTDDRICKDSYDTCSGSNIRYWFKFEGEYMVKTSPLAGMPNIEFTNGIVTQNMSEMIFILNTDASIPTENIFDAYVHQAPKRGSPHFKPMNFTLFTTADCH